MSINHKGNCYFKLRWDEDKIKSFSFSCAVALNVLNRLEKKVEQNLYEEYADIFNQQQEKGIIEQIYITREMFETIFGTS